MSVRKPDFFIVGAPKCATTSMNYYLKLHPEIFIPSRKELHYFGFDLSFAPPRITANEYLQYFQLARNEKRVGETSVWYLYSKTAAEEIQRFCPSASIIIMLRNPVDMIYSLHSENLFHGFEDLEDFKSALKAEFDRKRSARIPRNVDMVDALFYRDVANYAPQVKRYLQCFGREKVHVIIFESFKEDAAHAYRETLQFLGVSESFQCPLKALNPNTRARSKVLLDVTRNIPRRFGWLYQSILPHRIRFGIKDLLMHFNTKKVPRTSMDANLRSELEKEFSPQIEQLSTLLDQDLFSIWRHN